MYWQVLVPLSCQVHKKQKQHYHAWLIWIHEFNKFGYFLYNNADFFYIYDKVLQYIS